MTEGDQNAPEPPPRGTRRKRRLALKACLISLVFIVLLGAVAAGGVYMMIGRTMSAPLWVQERIEDRFEADFAPLQIDFDELEFVLGTGWRPRIRLQNTAISDGSGREIVRLNRMGASLAMRPLLKGSVQPKRIYLSGVLATLRRDADGKMALLFGDGATPFRSAANLPQLLDSWAQTLRQPKLSALTSVSVDGVTLRYEDLFQGRAWTLDGGQLSMDRDGDELQISSSAGLLGGSDLAGLVEANFTSRIGDVAARFGISVRDIAAPDIAAQSVALGWLGVLRAPISGALRGQVDEMGKLGPLSATLQIGAGAVQPNDSARPIPFDGARSYFTYDPAGQVLEFDELSISSAWGSGLAEGRAYLGNAEGEVLKEMVGQFRFSELVLQPADLYETPLEIDGASADFRLELDPFRLQLGELLIGDDESELNMSGHLAAGSKGWQIAMDAHLNEMTPGRLIEIWPDGAAAKPRKWVTDNVRNGLLRDVNLALRIEPKQKPDVYVDFDFQDAEVKFQRHMPTMTGASGQATLAENRFVATASSGIVTADEGGAIDVSGTSFIIPDIGIREAAPGIVRFRGSGPITAALSLLNRPPLSVMDKTPLPVDLAKGNIDLTGTLATPLKKGTPFEEVEFHFDGSLEQVESTVLVPEHVVNAERLRIRGDQGQVNISGDGAIDGVPATVAWRQPIGKGAPKASRVEGNIELSQELLDTFRIALPKGTVSGQGDARFTIDFAPETPPALNVESELVGIDLRVPQIGWRKGPDTAGKLTLAATLSQPPKVESLSIEGAGLSAQGSVSLTGDGDLERVSFNPVRMGGWLNVRADLVGRGEAAPMLRVYGGTLDMRSAQFGSGGGGGGGASSPMEVSLDRLQITDTMALTGFSGSFSTTGGLNGEFRGRVNDGTAVTGRVVPQKGRSAFRLLSQDAGGVFRSAGVLKQGRDGSFELTLVPADQPGYFDGQLRVENTRVEDAPAIAALLNSISVIGLLDEMTGQGIQFTEVDARFLLGPSQLTLYSSSAVGPSIGISMDGTFDVRNALLNMQGVISPVYLLNSIGSVLTRKGEGLLGFNFTLTGPAADPRVGVNPLSALAPGAIREIFRAPAPTRPDGTTPATRNAPVAKPPAGGFGEGAGGGR